jgi:hypothetical protein
MIALNYKSTAAIARHLLAGTVKRLNSNSKLPHYSSRDIRSVNPKFSHMPVVLVCTTLSRFDFWKNTGGTDKFCFRKKKIESFAPIH